MSEQQQDRVNHDDHGENTDQSEYSILDAVILLVALLAIAALIIFLGYNFVSPVLEEILTEMAQ